LDLGKNLYLGLWRSVTNRIRVSDFSTLRVDAHSNAQMTMLRTLYGNR